MTTKERKKVTMDLVKGLEIAEYKMLKEKALRNDIMVQGDSNGGWKEIPARELFTEIYHEEVPIY